MDDVALVVRVQDDDLADFQHLSARAVQLRKVGFGQLSFAAREHVARHLRRLLPLSDGIEILSLPAGGWWDHLARASRCSFLATISISDLDDDVSPGRVLRDVTTAREAARDVARHTNEPIFLALPWSDRALTAAYVDHVLETPSDEQIVNYAGHVALSASRVIAEGVDRRAGAMQVQVLLDLPLTQPAPWRVSITAGTSQCLVAESAPTVLRRFDVRKGTLQRHRIEAEVPLRHVPDGTYPLGVRLLDAAAVPARSRPLRPSAGATACARTVSTAWLDAGQRRQLRYLIRPIGRRGERLGVTVQHGVGRTAAWRWRARRLRDDVAHVLHGPGGRRMRLLGLLRLLSSPLFLRRRPYVIGERPGFADDNGLHLFRHLRRVAPRRPVYFILDRHVAQYRELRRLGHVLPHSSWRHRLLMLHAEVLADSHSLKYLVPKGWPRRNYERHLAWRIGAIRVFLQHGIHLSPEAVNRRSTGYDMIVTSVHDETVALEEATGYTNQLVETVLPRFDALIPHTSTHTILVMPTWRRYLPSPGSSDTDPFEGSAYERFILGLLHNPSLNEVLTAYDYRLLVVPHVNIARAMTGYESGHERITLDTAPRRSVQELLLDCDALITDYSSVHFDAAYMGKPVIYARFDEAEYEARHARRSWFNFDRDGFGPVVRSLEDLTAQVEKVLARDCVREDEYDKRAKRFFGTIDHHNTERVVQTIDDLIATSRSALR
ncbi:CDP-glycerol glycerophosphotransferase family protein [Pseudactinotalea sp. Z1748]|uniref:CDP-glycerol glycerophosphotransferase family protein n=1 Tax=Pseudactinotalea sp. Z1748 TaxID=3413027 RepID=UPI003C7B9309